MQLDDVATPSLLVQAVGVLGDHGVDDPGVLQRLESAVRRVGLGSRPAVLKAVAPVGAGILAELRDRGDAVRIHRGPQPALAAKDRDAALGRDPRAGKGHAPPATGQELGGALQGRILDRAHLSPAKRSSSGVGASTRERTRS